MDGGEIISSQAALIKQWADLVRNASKSGLPAEETFAGLIKRWAALNRPAEEVQFKGSWSAVERLISPAVRCAEERIRELKTLVERSGRMLHPIGEPLKMSFPLHRWLAGDREEAYSDWLAWILEELGSPERVGYVLCGEKAPNELRICGGRCSVEREVWVPEGHPGRSGRLDCVVRFGNQALILLEVKSVNAESADTSKNEGYRRWLDSQPVPLRRAYLVATGGARQIYEGGFELVTWGDICRRLRHLIPHLVAEGRLLLAALVGGFVGAVEQNLLGVPSLAWLDLDACGVVALVLRSQVEAAVDYLNSIIVMGGHGNDRG